jgi:uncharacterized protein
MTISLYDATIPSFLQILGSLDHLIDKAEAHMAEHGVAEEELVQARLIDNMQPLAYQLKASAEHSRGAIEGVRAGVFTPQTVMPPQTFEELRAYLAHARDFLAALDPAEVNGFVGQDMRFEFKTTNIPFTAEAFLFSFAQPNFYFHATTAYDLLRHKGVKIGKMDFLGALQAKA